MGLSQVVAGLAILTTSTTWAGEDAPRHVADLTSPRPQAELAACVIRRLDKRGTVTTVPIEGGIAADWNHRGGPNFKARFTAEIRESGDQRTIGIFYRHPFSRKVALLLARDLLLHCSPETVDQIPPK